MKDHLVVEISFTIGTNVSNPAKANHDASVPSVAWIKNSQVKLSNGREVQLDESYFSGFSLEILRAIGYELTAEAERYQIESQS